MEYENIQGFGLPCDVMMDNLVNGQNILGIVYISCSKIRNSNIYSLKDIYKRVLPNCIYHFCLQRQSMEFSCNEDRNDSECGINHECDHLECIMCFAFCALIQISLIDSRQGLIIAVFFMILLMIWSGIFNPVAV